MPEWGRSPGWPTRNSSMRTCCSSDPWPVTSSGREHSLTNLRPSRDNSACGSLRRAFQTSGGKLQNRSTKPTGSPAEIERGWTRVGDEKVTSQEDFDASHDHVAHVA